MVVILTKPYKIGSRIHKIGTEIDLESNTAKRMIKKLEAKRPGVFFKAKKIVKRKIKKL